MPGTTTLASLAMPKHYPPLFNGSRVGYCVPGTRRPFSTFPRKTGTGTSPLRFASLRLSQSPFSFVYPQNLNTPLTAPHLDSTGTP